MTSKQRKREVRKQTKLKTAKSALFAYFDLFNSTVIDDDSKWNIFSKFTNILQRFQQLQFLHRESNLLNLLHDCLMNFVLNWFKNQSKFISLHDFDIVFTKIFSSNESATNSTTSRKQQKFENSISDRCQWCQLIYETWNSHRFQYFSCDAQNQQAYEFALQFLEEYTNEIVEQQKANALKIAKKTKINAIKNVKRVKSKALKAEKTAKSISTIQNIDIFDSIFTCEDRQFSEFAKFLQYFQQCQHLYRESDLLMLLLICLWSSAFDIWFDRQTIMKSTSLSEWIDILRVDFANVSFSRIKIANVICMRCNSNFNFKEKFREHVREQHVKKSINCSSFSIDTVKSICETMKKSTIIDSSASFVSQKFDISIATSKQKFESVMISETIHSSKESHFTFSSSETVSESMKNSSINCSFISSKSSFFQTFESESQEISVWKFSKFCSFLSIDTITSVYEIEKKSAIIETFALQISHVSFTTSRNQIAFEIVSSNNSSFQTETHKSICESKKNSTVICLFVSFISQKSSTIRSVFKKNCSICRINVFSIQEHYLESSSCYEALRQRLKQQFTRRAHQRKQKVSKQTKIEKTINQLVKNFHFSVNAINLLCEIEKTSFVSHKSESTKKFLTCRRCNRMFNFNNKFHDHIRQHHARKFFNNLNLQVFASEFTYEIKKKSTLIDSFVSFIFSSIFSHTFVSKRQEFHIQKFYLIMNELHHMFAEKFKSFDLQQHQIRDRFSQSFDFRSFDRSCSTFLKKSYFIIENLFEMFDEKLRKKSLFQNQNNVSFREFFSNQSRITIYFKFTINQKSSINQNSKNSKSRNLNQHMSAKSIRIVFNKNLFENLTKLSYKLSDVFCHLKFSNQNKTAEIVFCIFIFFHFFSIFFFVFAIVSIVSAATMNCINVYEQVILIIDRVIQ